MARPMRIKVARIVRISDEWLGRRIGIRSGTSAPTSTNLLPTKFAATLLESLYENCIFLIPKSFNRVLVAATAESSTISFLSQLFQLAIASSQPLNSAYFLTVAKALAKSDDCAELLRLTKQVMEITSPSMTVINRIIFAFDECGETEKALLIFSQMKTLDFVPNLYTHNTVLEILGCAGLVDEMLGQFGSMKEAGIAPDVVSYNTVLNNLGKLGKFDVCLFYYKEIGENGVKADLLTYTAVIESLGRSGNVEEALRFFDEMKERQIRPFLYVYRSLITNLKKMGKVDLALSLTDEMNLCDSELAGPMDFKRNK
nr:pentatricopeptide repeat-containing protein At1g11900 [Malus domestica]